MKIEFKYVDFFKPIFSQGKNFGNKVKADSAVSLTYDTDLELMFMTYKGQTMVHKGEFSGDVVELATILPPSKKTAKHLSQGE